MFTLIFDTKNLFRYITYINTLIIIRKTFLGTCEKKLLTLTKHQISSLGNYITSTSYKSREWSDLSPINKEMLIFVMMLFFNSEKKNLVDDVLMTHIKDDNNSKLSPKM